ncbi:transcription termination factor Rho [Verrucomicrobiales bacterium]|jgi:transcription termination factor Rho|nr:transcription termination factor Rho [Verrucomicrobiales bacterium]
MTEDKTTADTEVAANEKEDEIKVPESLNVNEFQELSLNALHKAAQEAKLRVAGLRSKHQIVFEILKFYGSRGTEMVAEGYLDFSGDNFGFLRWPSFSFASNADDVYVAAQLIKKFDLQPGHKVKVQVRAPKDREKFLSAGEILEIEGITAEEWKAPDEFDHLVAMFPSDRLILESNESSSPSSRVIDLIAPLGKGQRGLIVAPPRGGKTILLKNIAVSVYKNNPEVKLIVMLLDERPEEVTDFKETVDADVFSSTFDESSSRHIEVADMVLNRAKRLVEEGKDVVVLLDSLTRLARAHNSSNQSGGGGGGGGGRRGKQQRRGGGGGAVGSGGISPKALERSRRFFGAARNVEDGGSLTILATCLIETDSRMDDVIFEEFKGTGNMEITLDREMAESRIFPAIHLLKSGTRKDELLYHPEEYQRISSLRKQMAQRPAAEAMQVLLKLVGSTGSNAELLLRGIQ